MTLAEIKSSYTLAKRDEDKGTFWGAEAMRPLSFPIAWFFIRLGVSANQVSTATIIIGLIGCFLLGSGQYYVMVAGAIMLNVRHILDYADGTLARATRTTSGFGGYLDSIFDEIMEVAMPLSFGIGLYLGDNLLLSRLLYSAFGFALPPNTYLVMGIIWGLAAVLSAFTLLTIKQICGISGYSYRPLKGNNGTFWWLSYKVGTNMQSLSTPILLVAILAHVMGFFMVFYTILAVCELGAILFKGVGMTKANDR